MVIKRNTSVGRIAGVYVIISLVDIVLLTPKRLRAACVCDGKLTMGMTVPYVVVLLQANINASEAKPGRRFAVGGGYDTVTDGWATGVITHARPVVDQVYGAAAESVVRTDLNEVGT